MGWRVNLQIVLSDSAALDRAEASDWIHGMLDREGSEVLDWRYAPAPDGTFPPPLFVEVDESDYQEGDAFREDA